jgi:hypothetical protein
MLHLWIATLLLATSAFAADLLVVCGGDEVFQIDPAANPPAKIWSWRAKDRPEIPDDLRGTFNTTDECKPLDGGGRLLVTSSGGGCALIEHPSGRVLWWARVPNAHSIEALPGGRIAVASSVSANGNKVLLFDEKVPGKSIAELPLPSAHGLMWDEARKCLWALGFGELLACEIAGDKLVVTARHKLPNEDGHDLRAVPGSADLMLSTHAGVWRFHRDDASFRPDPLLKGRADVKSADIHPTTGRHAIVQAAGGNWWTDRIELLEPAGTIRLPGERLYKARWLMKR